MPEQVVMIPPGVEIARSQLTAPLKRGVLSAENEPWPWLLSVRGQVINV